MMEFRTEDLYSKYGFDDGGLLIDFLEEHGIADIGSQEALFQVVKELVVPMITPPVEVVRWHSSHNPIRVRDDEEYEGPSAHEIYPKVVKVADSDVLALLRIMQANAKDQRLIDAAKKAERRIELRLERFRLMRRVAELNRELESQDDGC